VLLLEAGLLTVLVAPLNFFGLHDAAWHHCHDSVSMQLVRWLLFRLTFASGVAKLTSASESWWSLTGQSRHTDRRPSIYRVGDATGTGVELPLPSMLYRPP